MANVAPSDRENAPPRGGTAASSHLAVELLLDDPKMFNG